MLPVSFPIIKKIMTKQEKLRQIVAKESYRSTNNLTLGYVRYESLRQLHPPEFKKLHEKTFTGKRFDDLVDDLVIESYG
jgi:hypothetical protein